MTDDETERIARIAFVGFVVLSVAAAVWTLLVASNINVIFGAGVDLGSDTPAFLMPVFPLVIGLIGSGVIWARWLRSAK